MNPVEEGNNQFAELFKAMPAARIGKAEDIAGAVLYLSSKAGVSVLTKCALGDLQADLEQAYVDGRCLCVDGGRVLLANGQ
jgi:NAD(P)-dependent dehydrogenase (short-subunit alcohol dehydrogenase family)